MMGLLLLMATTASHAAETVPNARVALGLSGGGCRTGNYALGVLHSMAALRGTNEEGEVESAVEALNFMASVSGAGWGVGAIYAEGAEEVGLPSDGMWARNPLQAALLSDPAALYTDDSWDEVQKRMRCRYNIRMGVGTGTALVTKRGVAWGNKNGFGKVLINQIAGVRRFEQGVDNHWRDRSQGLTLSDVTAGRAPTWYPVSTWLDPTLAGEGDSMSSYAPYGYVHDPGFDGDAGYARDDKRNRMCIIPFSADFFKTEMPLQRYMTIAPRNHWVVPGGAGDGGAADVGALPIAMGLLASSAVPPAAPPVVMGVGADGASDEDITAHYLVDGAFSDRYSVSTAARWLVEGDAAAEPDRGVLLLIYSRPRLEADWWTTNGRIPHKVGIQQAFEIDNVLTDYEDLTPILDASDIAGVNAVTLKSPAVPDGPGVHTLNTQVLSLGMDLLDSNSLWEGWDAGAVCRGAVRALYGRVSFISTDAVTQRRHQPLVIAAGEALVYFQQHRLSSALWPETAGMDTVEHAGPPLPAILVPECSDATWVGE